MPTFQGRHWPGTLSFLHRVFTDPSSTGISGQTFLGKHKGWNPGAREISQSTGSRQRKHSWNSTPIKSQHCALWSPDRHFYADMIESLIKFIHQKLEGNCTILLFCKRNWGQTGEELRQVMKHFSGSHRTLTLLSACQLRTPVPTFLYLSFWDKTRSASSVHGNNSSPLWMQQNLINPNSTNSE